MVVGKPVGRFVDRHDGCTVFLGDVCGIGNMIKVPMRDQNVTDRLQLIRLEKSPDTEALESVYRKGQQTIHRSLFPLFASEPTCAACHNKLQRLAGNKQWQVGDLMGAQYIDQNIDHQLTHVNNTVRLVSVLVFLTVLAGSFCCLFLYRQF